MTPRLALMPLCSVLLLASTAGAQPSSIAPAPTAVTPPPSPTAPPPLAPMPTVAPTAVTPPPPPSPRVVTAEPVAPPPAPAPPAGRSIDRLMSQGVTVGAAFTLEMGRVFPNSNVSQDTTTATLMPYVVLAPAYWGGSNGELCAAHLTVSEERLRPLKERAGVASAWGTCLAYKLGLFLGKPLSYETSTSVARDGKGQALREVKPLVAAGVTLTPSAYVSVLLGLTFSEITREDGTGGSIVTPTLALGFNADALALLF